MLKEGDCANFDTLLRAAEDGNLCLLECQDKATGKYVAVVCAVNEEEDDVVSLVPIAKLFEGDPYEEVAGPMDKVPPKEWTP